MIWGTYMKLVTKYQISAINSCWEKCAYMFNVDTNQLSRQTGSRNLMVPKKLPTIWHTYVKLVTKYQISAINSCWEKCDEKYFGRTDDRGKTVYPPPPSGSGDIIRSKMGSKCVDLILIRLAKCWNNFFSSKFCIWLYCENGKFMIILWKWQLYDYTVKMSSRNIFVSLVQPNFFLQDSESK
jgi:hypothetical protein